MEILQGLDKTNFYTKNLLSSSSLKENELLVHVKAVGKKIEIQQTPEASFLEVAGQVIDMGAQMTSFHQGDQIYGIAKVSSSLEGCYSIDGRCVALMPSFLGYTHAATLPFICLHAYHILFNQLKISSDTKQNILIVGGEKRISRLLLNLIKTLTLSQVIITYDQESNKSYIEQEKADEFLNTAESFLSHLQHLNIPYFDSIFSTSAHKHLFADYNRILRPFGEVCLIEDEEELQTIKLHSLPFSEEEQGQILQHASLLIKQQKIPFPAVFSQE